MADEIEHHGISGMHWGHRKTPSNNPTNEHQTSNIVKGILFGSHTMDSKVSVQDKARVQKAEKIVGGLLLTAFVGVNLHAAMDHLIHNPIKIHIDYTRPPFKKAVEPYFKATIKKIVPKLLPGS